MRVIDRYRPRPVYTRQHCRPRKTTMADFEGIDWSQRDERIARCLGTSACRVSQVRSKLGKTGLADSTPLAAITDMRTAQDEAANERLDLRDWEGNEADATAGELGGWITPSEEDIASGRYRVLTFEMLLSKEAAESSWQNVREAHLAAT